MPDVRDQRTRVIGSVGGIGEAVEAANALRPKKYRCYRIYSFEGQGPGSGLHLRLAAARDAPVFRERWPNDEQR